MSYINNLKVKKGGLNKRQINSLTSELDKLLKIYPAVIIKEITDIMNDENNSAEYWNNVISICPDTNFTTDAEYIRIRRENRKEFRENYGDDIKEGEDVGIEFIRNNYIWTAHATIKRVARHEFAHALDEHYNLGKNEKIVKLFKSLDKKLITDNLCEYASNDIHEFIAVAFEESFYSDCSKLAKKVRKLVDDIVKEIDYKRKSKLKEIREKMEYEC